jgi:microcin C transport system permease protein
MARVLQSSATSPTPPSAPPAPLPGTGTATSDVAVVAFLRPAMTQRQRAWARFRRHRRGYWSLWIFLAIFALSLFAELLSNDRPILVKHDGEYYIPLFHNYPETTFGGDFLTETDYHDPYIQEQLTTNGNWAVWPLNRYRFDTLNYFAPSPNPAAPSSVNYLGTDDRGRDVLARLIYGLRISVWFGMALTAIGMALGILAGAIQGYFAGRIDLTMQRLIEVWSSIPELYLLLILASIFEPSIWVLLAILSLFGWMGLSDYVRAEFLRNRGLEYVAAARALGLRRRTIITRHVLPNSMTPVIAFLPFRMSAAIVALTSLDFLGLGVPPSTPSLGELLAQGKANLDAWWISLPTFAVLVGILLLLIFVGEALRDALDTRKS